MYRVIVTNDEDMQVINVLVADEYSAVQIVEYAQGFGHTAEASEEESEDES